MFRRLHFYYFWFLGDVEAAAFLFVLAILGMFRRLQFDCFWPFGRCSGTAFYHFTLFWQFRGVRFSYFRPFCPCSRGCIYITMGHFGHVCALAFFLFWAILAMFTRLHGINFGRFGHAEAAAFCVLWAVWAMFRLCPFGHV